jgi:hypothetical protein
MTDTEFLKRKLRQLAEERTPQVCHEYQVLRMEFANSGRLGSGAQAYAEADLYRRRFTDLARGWARFYLEFCEKEGVAIERYLDFVDTQGLQTIKQWIDSNRELRSAVQIKAELKTILDAVQKDALRGYVGSDIVYRPPPPWSRRVLKAMFPPDSPARFFWPFFVGICLLVIAASLGLRR